MTIIINLSEPSFMLFFTSVSVLLVQVGKDNLSRHVRDRLDREIQEKEDNQREKTESHLYTEIRIVRDEDMQKYIADGNHFDLVDVSKVRPDIETVPWAECQAPALKCTF